MRLQPLTQAQASPLLCMCLFPSSMTKFILIEEMKKENSSWLLIKKEKETLVGSTQIYDQTFRQEKNNMRYTKSKRSHVADILDPKQNTVKTKNTESVVVQLILIGPHGCSFFSAVLPRRPSRDSHRFISWHRPSHSHTPRRARRKGSHQLHHQIH